MLGQLQGSLGKLAQQDYPPVEKWNPPFCGEIPLTIDAAGQWWYDGSLIKRPALVRLFSRVLKREGDQYFLVTPVEKVQINVVDVPLLVVSWERQDNGYIRVSTSCDDHVDISIEHPLEMRFNETSQCDIPYIMMRNNLWAKVQQNVYYQLAAELDIKADHAWLQSGDYCADFGPIIE
ncbi:MAG: DUF1285 domain-containing protein [Glaciecola sp.]|nr:DUF1285 domain-containing protein [Glaciecola sp.]MDG1468839.1 DUF1285 domain-containing protein [Glaciecola sp.]